MAFEERYEGFCVDLIKVTKPSRVLTINVEWE
jgi:hypothetical protein